MRQSTKDAWKLIGEITAGFFFFVFFFLVSCHQPNMSPIAEPSTEGGSMGGGDAGGNGGPGYRRGDVVATGDSESQYDVNKLHIPPEGMSVRREQLETTYHDDGSYSIRYRNVDASAPKMAILFYVDGKPVSGGAGGEAKVELMRLAKTEAEIEWSKKNMRNTPGEKFYVPFWLNLSPENQ